MKAKIIWRAQVLRWIAWCLGIPNMVVVYGCKKAPLEQSEGREAKGERP